MSLLVAIDWVMRQAIANTNHGIRWNLTSMLEDLEFSDDIPLLSSNADHLKKKTQDIRTPNWIEHQ